MTGLINPSTNQVIQVARVLGRLVEPTSREDIIHIGGVLHVLDAQTGYLVPVGFAASDIEGGRRPRS